MFYTDLEIKNLRKEKYFIVKANDSDTSSVIMVPVNDQTQLHPIQITVNQ